MVTPTGICQTMITDGIGGISFWIIQGVTFFISFAMLFARIAKEHQDKSSGYYSANKNAVFPVHLNVLIVLCAASFNQAVIFSSVGYLHPTSLPSINRASIAIGFCYATTHSVTEGTTMLLLSAGIGRQALIRAAMIGVLTGLIIGSIFAFSFVETSYGGNLFLADQETNYGLNVTVNFTLLVVYSVLWLAPNRGYFVRRPGLIFWSRFLCAYRFFATLGHLLKVGFIDLGWCVVGINQLVAFGFIKGWAMYVAFIKEADYWHGVDNERALDVCLCCGDNNSEHDLVSTWVKLTRMNPFVSYTEAVSAERSSTASDQRPITCPLQGVELTQGSAVALFNAADYMNNSQRKPLKGNNGPVLLLDFISVKIIQSRCLGSGSSAKVYEGRWTSKVVAIKVMIAIEITPNEIHRTCDEASLLHRLNGASQHIVRLFGVAIQPPSLCVCLELCNEGSMFDLLHKKRIPLPWQSRLELALGAARGLEAFSMVLPGYSHNDIKPGNFLVHSPQSEQSDQNPDNFRYIAKLADVELASLGITPFNILNGDALCNYVAPEVLSGMCPVSPASDVFAFANVLFEIETGSVPFGNEKSEKVSELLVLGQRPIFPDIDSAHAGEAVGPGKSKSAEYEVESRIKVRELIVKCWAQGAEDRPGISSISSALSSIRSDYLLQLRNMQLPQRASFVGKFHRNGNLENA
jgi:hypothetical protein